MYNLIYDLPGNVQDIIFEKSQRLNMKNLLRSDEFQQHSILMDNSFFLHMKNFRKVLYKVRNLNNIRFINWNQRLFYESEICESVKYIDNYGNTNIYISKNYYVNRCLRIRNLEF